MTENSVLKSQGSAQLLRLWRCLRPRRRRQFAVLVLLMLVSAVLEVISLGAVIPFLGILSEPNWLLAHPQIAERLATFGVDSPQSLLLPLTVAFIAAAVIAGAVRTLLSWVSTRLSFASGADLSLEVYRRTLNQPYEVHVARNSSEVISSITTKVSGSVVVLYNVLTLLSSTVLLVTIAVALIAMSPLVALISTVLFGGSYAVISAFSRRRLRRNSRRIAQEQTQVIKVLQEGLGGIRDVLLDGAQPIYSEAYRRADQPLRRAQASNNFLGAFPRFALEALGMVIIAVLAYAMSGGEGGLAAAIPTLGALALGAQRMLPVLQQGFAAWAGMAGNHALLADTLTLLEAPMMPEVTQHVAPLDFGESIRFAEVGFRYGRTGAWVLRNVTLSIERGARVGFVGSTGSGKSTLLDLLMGLLTPLEGAVMVDGKPLEGDRIRAWQQTIAHVPQSIFLADATIAQNIAFNVPEEAIDLDRVREAARQAQIAEFIETCPNRYQTLVGERGVRLSGGQRQRIGIARALYKRAKVIIFDEATSALDNTAEQMLMNAIDALDSGLTILIVAHRLSTVRGCGLIVQLEHGSVVAQGSFEQLLDRSPSFRRMAHVTA